MLTYDVLMLAVLVGACVWGAYKGFVWQLASLASIGISYLVAIRFRGQVAELIGAEPPWNMFAAMLILYVGTSIVIWLACRVVSKTIDDLKLNSFDRQIGALFGAAKGVILCLIITLFAVTLLEGSQRQSILDSRSGYYLAHLINRTHTMMPPEVHEVLAPYLHRLDPSLDHPDQVLGHGRSPEAVRPELLMLPTGPGDSR
jgi:membrane protein required for colicin V production